MIGTEVSSYRILDKLGEGGMGVVYKAVDTNLDRMVAIKVLNNELSRNPELVQRFRAEAKAQANLNHTNLATLYTFIVQDGLAMMVMEFVDGETVEQMLMRRGPIPANEAIPIFRQALLGIGYAHRMGIVHRDIKPSNIMLNRGGIVKVMDFGIAKVLGGRGMTRTGTQMGTGLYMSPEQVLNKNVDFRSDVYSLGVTLYQMLTANTPFQADSDYQIMADHVHTAPPPPTRFYPYIPKGFENAVLKALEKNPDARFQTVEEFGAALEHPDDFAFTAAAAAPPAVAPVFAPRTPPPQGSPGYGYSTPPPVPAYSGPSTPAPGGPPLAAASAPFATRLATPPPITPGVPPGPYQASPYQTPSSQTTPYQMEPGGIPAAPPVPPLSPLEKFFRSTEGKVVGAAGLLMILLIAGWLAFRPSPAPYHDASNGGGGSATGGGSPLGGGTGVDGKQTPINLGTGHPALLRVVSFTPDSTSLAAAGKVHLTWQVSGATEVEISPGIGKVDAQGSAEVQVDRTTTYTLIARDASGKQEQGTAIVQVGAGQTPPVNPNPAAPAVNVFEAQAGTIRAGESTTLRWSVAGAATVTIGPGVGTFPAEGSVRISPSQSMTYVLIARSASGQTTTRSLTVEVAASQPAVAVRPEISFSANPTVIAAGGSAVLSWNVRNAQSASIDPQPGALNQAAGQVRVTPAATTTYRLTATSRDGTAATATAVVEVSAGAAPPPPPVARGGAASRAMNVYHDHGIANTMSSCWGVLQVVNGHLVYRVTGTSDGRRDDFDAPLSAMGEVKTNRLLLHGRQAFHVVVNGQHFNFIPADGSTVQDVMEIENASKSR
jgi:serine/threonine protein kinase